MSKNFMAIKALWFEDGEVVESDYPTCDRWTITTDMDAEMGNPPHNAMADMSAISADVSDDFAATIRAIDYAIDAETAAEWIDQGRVFQVLLTHERTGEEYHYNVEFTE